MLPVPVITNTTKRNRKLMGVPGDQQFDEPLRFQSETNLVESATTPLADIVSETHRNLERRYADIDFMGFKKQAGTIKKLFPKLGYTPREIFNAMAGDKRLIFNDLE